GFGEGATAVYFGAPAPRAGELRFDEGHDPEIAAGRRELVGRNHGVDRGCKERRLGLGQREIGCRFAPSRGNGSRRSRGLLGLRGSGWGEARGNGGGGGPQKKGGGQRVCSRPRGFFRSWAPPCLPRQSLMLHAGTRSAPRGDLSSPRGDSSCRFE